ncbi:DUF5709 domain-containing protein [Nocardioides sp.]|uniref:DUF5709 domain-containing protein n=1 Tax=Nocardioides sp. TaxID=35761 RepID=UPI002611390D|nr:DUF5709 domain-containing protein [Nocardioides sp.]
MTSETNDGPLDGDQLSAEDTLEDRGVDDLLDEGYSPPERYLDPTQGESDGEGEGIDEWLRQEEPDPVASLAYGEDSDDGDDGEETSLDDGEVGDRRSGRLEQVEGEPDGFAYDVGIDGGAASAEEAAMHEIPEEP